MRGCDFSLRGSYVTGLALLAMTFTAPLAAQDGADRRGLAFEGAGGFAVPTGALSDYADSGPSTALRVNYWLSPRFALELGGAAGFLDGKPVAADRRLPDMNLWHYSMGLAANVLPPTSRLSLLGSLGLGVTRFDTDLFEIGNLEPTELAENYFSAEGGLKVRYDLFEDIGAFVEGRAHWIQARQEDFVPLTAFDPERLAMVDGAWVVPLRAGLEIRI